MKKLISLFAIALFASLSVFAQSSEQLSKILKSEKVTFAEASYLPAVYANLVSEESTEEEAFKALQDNGYFDAEITPDLQVNLSQLCNIYMKVFDIKGGLLYSIFKSPRYAFKEFKAISVLPSEADPSMAVSGRDSIDIFNSCLEISGGNE